MHKRKWVFAAALLSMAAAALVLGRGEPAYATASSRDASSLGLVLTSGTVDNDFDGLKYSVNISFVRLPGSTTFLPGFVSITGGSTNLLAAGITAQPFLANMGSWNDAFINADVTYNGQPAKLISILQGPGMNRLLLAIVTPDYSQTLLILAGGFEPGSTVIVNP
jgi:hypothetical protein